MTAFEAHGLFCRLRVAYRMTKPARVVPAAQVKHPGLFIHSPRQTGN